MCIRDFDCNMKPKSHSKGTWGLLTSSPISFKLTIQSLKCLLEFSSLNYLFAYKNKRIYLALPIK